MPTRRTRGFEKGDRAAVVWCFFFFFFFFPQGFTLACSSVRVAPLLSGGEAERRLFLRRENTHRETAAPSLRAGGFAVSSSASSSSLSVRCLLGTSRSAARVSPSPACAPRPIPARPGQEERHDSKDCETRTSKKERPTSSRPPSLRFRLPTCWSWSRTSRSCAGSTARRWTRGYRRRRPRPRRRNASSPRWYARERSLTREMRRTAFYAAFFCRLHLSLLSVWLVELKYRSTRPRTRQERRSFRFLEAA